MHAEYDCPWQCASGAESGTSLSSLEGFREFEADLSAFLSMVLERYVIILCLGGNTGKKILAVLQ